MPDTVDAAAEGTEAEKVDVEIQDEEEAEPLAVSPSPLMPSAAEVEAHRITHIPFRRWCRECMMGRGIGEQRGRHAGRPTRLPLWASTTST